MSGFDGSKLGGPPKTDFFSESAAAQANNQTRSGLGLEDYNPFADQTTNQMNEPLPQGTMTVAGDTATQAVHAHHQPTIAELQRRQEELDRKAAELAQREEALRNGTFNARANNWPPLPGFCPMQPCFYQDIGVDIPLEFQNIVRTMYYLWVFYAMVLILNLLSSMVLMFIDKETLTIFGMALVTTAIFIPGSFVCWFRPLYKAFRSDSSFSFMVFFLVFFSQLIISIISAVGIGSSSLGSFGFINAIGEFSTNTGAAIVMMVIASLHAIFATASAFMLMRVHRLYRGTGASFAKAQAEFASGVLRNEHVQGAAANVAAEAARQAVHQNMGQGGNRY